MSEFIRVASLNDLTDPGRQLVELEDRVVVFVRCVAGHEVPSVHTGTEP